MKTAIRQLITGRMLAEVPIFHARHDNPRGLWLAEATLSGIDLAGADMGDSIVGMATFQRADLSDASLLGAMGNNSVFQQCRMFGTSFQGASLERTRFSDCDIAAANFDSTMLLEACFDSCSVRWTSFQNPMIFEWAKFSRVRFWRCRFYDSNILSAEMSQCEFYGSIFF